jgi:Mg2+ and Co2+ transporter CorA
MEVVISVTLQQRNAIRSMKRVLDNHSFRVTNQVRIEAFDTLENPTIKRFLEFFDSTHRKEMQDLHREADKLAESLRYNIAIEEEGNLKAILIFTLVAIVFLPLSFVLSVFGMNTVDVRDMGSTQTLFWAVALPVTATVGGMSLLTAYGGPVLQQHVQRL